MTGLRGTARAFAEHRLGGTAIVLTYHRVVELERDPQLLAVSPEHFDAQMAMLAGRHVVSLPDLLEDLRRHRVPERAVAITFDDGYVDNLVIAGPILAEHKIPATVFVSSGHMIGQREFWWDELERLILGPGTLPGRITLGVPSKRFEGSPGELAEYPPDAAERDRGWNVLEPARNARQQLYIDLCAFVRPLSADDQREILRQLREAAGFPAQTRNTHRPLNTGEVARLDTSPFASVGAHTADHVLLSARPDPEQRSQIFSDRDVLAGVCDRPIREFSYPFGGLEDYTADIERLVRDAGFTGACANHPGVVKPWTDPFRLPRMLVRDWDAETFGRKIRGWFGVRR